MQKGYISPKDFEKQFKIKPSQNSQDAQVTENLSGRTQLLKSTDNSVVYKNFNEGDIEETSLVGDAYNRSIQADQTDQYDQNVTTSHLELAPKINKQTTLTDSHNTIINHLTETVNTSDHRETLNLNQEVYIQNKQETISTNLQQKINNFGGLASQALTRQTDTRNVNSQNYTERFGQLKTQGNMNISGNGSLNAKKIYIGGPAPDERIDFTLRKIANQYFPTVSGQILGKSLPLGIFKTANFLITGQLDLEIDLNAQDRISVNPVEFNQKGLSISLCETINQYYAGFDIDSVDGLENLPDQAPTVGVTFMHGSMVFENGLQIRVLKAYCEFIYKTTNDINVNDYQDWQLHMVTNATLTIRCFFMPSASAPNTSEHIMEIATQDYQQIEQALKEWSSKLMDNPILTANASYEQTQINNGGMLIEDASVADSADIGGNLIKVGSLVKVSNQPLVLRLINFGFETLKWEPIK